MSKYVIDNYEKIQEDIGKNEFPLEKNMFKQILEDGKNIERTRNETRNKTIR